MADEVQEHRDVSYVRLLRDPSLLAVLAIGFMGAVGTNSIPTALPAIGEAFTVTSGRIGLVMTAFFLPVIFMNPVVGVLIDMYGRRRIVIPALMLFGATGLAIVPVESFRALLLLRVLQGIAFAGTLPLTVTLMGDLYTGAQGSAAQGLRSSVTGAANSLAPVFAGALAAMNWRYPFLMFALAFPVLGLVYWYYPEPIEPTVESGTATELRAELRSYWRAIRAEANDRNLAVLIFGGFTLFFVKQGLKTYVPVVVVRAIGADVSTAGLVLGVYGAIRVLVSPFAGTATARIGRKHALLGSLIAIVVGTVLVPFAGSVPALIGIVGGYAVGEALFHPVLSSGVADLASDEHRGGIMSGLATLQSIANTLSPVVIGVLIAVSGFVAAFGAVAAVGAVYGVGLLFLVDRDAIR